MGKIMEAIFAVAFGIKLIWPWHACLSTISDNSFNFSQWKFRKYHKSISKDRDEALADFFSNTKNTF